MAGDRNLPDIALPSRIVSRRDLISAARELEKLRDALVAQEVRREEGKEAGLTPRFSDTLRALFEANNITSLNEEQVDKLKHDLEYLADRVPVLRFVFAGEPGPRIMIRLIEWVRREIHPSALVIYSIQPTIAGGFVLTTDRRRYDLSWRGKLYEKPLKLGKVLRGEQQAL